LAARAEVGEDRHGEFVGTVALFAKFDTSEVVAFSVAVSCAHFGGHVVVAEELAGEDTTRDSVDVAADAGVGCATATNRGRSRRVGDGTANNMSIQSRKSQDWDTHLQS
jgi:hypothetical protein